MATAKIAVSVRDVGLVVEILECMKEAHAVLKAHLRAEESGQMACRCGAVSTACAALERAATLAGDGDGPAVAAGHWSHDGARWTPEGGDIAWKVRDSFGRHRPT